MSHVTWGRRTQAGSGWEGQQSLVDCHWNICVNFLEGFAKGPFLGPGKGPCQRGAQKQGRWASESHGQTRAGCSQHLEGAWDARGKGGKDARHLFRQVVGRVWKEEAALGSFTNHWSSSVSCGLQIPAALVTVNKMHVGGTSLTIRTRNPFQSLLKNDHLTLTELFEEEETQGRSPAFSLKVSHALL